MRIDKEQMNQNCPAYIIAEIGNNHQGSLDTALAMVRIAKEYCGVSAVKFQKRDNDSLFTEEFSRKPYVGQNSFGATYGEHRVALELSESDFCSIRDLCRELDVDLIVTPFDKKSVDLLDSIEIRNYKIASSDIDNIPQIEYAAKKADSLIISTGCASLEDIDLAYQTAMKYHHCVGLLHCICKYPPEVQEYNLRSILVLAERYKDAVVGYSGHDIGIEAPVAARVLGANIIEKHYTLNKDLPGGDHKISLDSDEMKTLVESLQRIDLMLGKCEKRRYDFEEGVKMKLGKSLYASRDIYKGTKLTAQDICIKTPSGHISPASIGALIGRTVLKDMSTDQPFQWEEIE